jgi:hypothetical protein
MPLDRPQFVTRDRLFDREPALETADPQARLVEIDLVAAQSYRLAHPQAVAIEHERQQMVAGAVPAALERFDLAFGQEVATTLVPVGRTSLATFDISPVDRPSCHERNLLTLLRTG